MQCNAIIVFVSDIFPINQNGGQVTKEFLQKVVDVLMDFVNATNDRNEKILDFHHPTDMQKLLDLNIPDKGVTLQQLINDCHTTLKYQVKTGENFYFKYTGLVLKVPLVDRVFVFLKRRVDACISACHTHRCTCLYLHKPRRHPYGSKLNKSLSCKHVIVYEREISKIE